MVVLVGDMCVQSITAKHTTVSNCYLLLLTNNQCCHDDGCCGKQMCVKHIMPICTLTMPEDAYG